MYLSILDRGGDSVKIVRYINGKKTGADALKNGVLTSSVISAAVKSINKK
jgi:hypothetical protein